jgi:hypothetical protein
LATYISGLFVAYVRHAPGGFEPPAHLHPSASLIADPLNPPAGRALLTPPSETPSSYPYPLARRNPPPMPPIESTVLRSSVAASSRNIVLHSRRECASTQACVTVGTKMDKATPSTINRPIFPVCDINETLTRHSQCTAMAGRKKKALCGTAYISREHSCPPYCTIQKGQARMSLLQLPALRHGGVHTHRRNI